MKISAEKTSIRNYIIMLFVVLSTDTVSLPVENHIVTVFISILSLGLFFLYLLKRMGYVPKDVAIFVIGACCICFLSQIFHGDSSLSYEFTIVLLLLGFCIANTMGFEEFSGTFINVMCLIAGFSLALYGLVQLGSSLWTLLPLVQNGEYYSAILSVIPVNLAHRIRIWGPFWEPGAYQAYIIIALLFSSIRKERIWKIILLTATLIFTFSTTGYICAVIILAIYINANQRYKHVKTWIWCVCAVVIIIAVLQNNYVQTTVMGKIYTGDSSFQIRLMDIAAYFHIGIHNPILGTGISHSYYSVMEQYRQSIYSGYTGSTSTTMREFAGLGGLFAVFRLILQYRFAKHITTNKINTLLSFILILILLNTEDFMYSLFFHTIFMYGLNSVWSRNRKGQKIDEKSLNCCAKLQRRKIFRKDIKQHSQL